MDMVHIGSIAHGRPDRKGNEPPYPSGRYIAGPGYDNYCWGAEAGEDANPGTYGSAGVCDE